MKRKRSFGTKTLAFASVMIGLYSQFAAMALLIAGGLLAPTGAVEALTMAALGILYLGLMVLAYFAGYAFWAGHAWAWTGGLVMFGTLAVASVLLLLVSTNVMSVTGPIIGAGAGIWYLLRPATRASLYQAGTSSEALAGGPVAPLDAPQASH